MRVLSHCKRWIENGKHTNPTHGPTVVTVRLQPSMNFVAAITDSLKREFADAMDDELLKMLACEVRVECRLVAVFLVKGEDVGGLDATANVERQAATFIARGIA